MPAVADTEKPLPRRFWPPGLDEFRRSKGWSIRTTERLCGKIVVRMGEYEGRLDDMPGVALILAAAKRCR